MGTDAEMEEFVAVLKQIADIAAVAGVRGRLDVETGVFFTEFRFESGRSHRVNVRPTGRAANRTIISFEAAAFEYPKQTFVASISQKDLLGLLLANHTLSFARYGIFEREKDYLVIASIDCLLETLDAPEFFVAINAVATAADTWEASKGGDKF